MSNSSGVILPAFLFAELVSSRLSTFGDVPHLLWPLLTSDRTFSMSLSRTLSCVNWTARRSDLPR